jgi:cytochrome d ubiquinol oxidase subunit I
MSIAAFVATGFAVAGIHALMMLRKKNVIFHRKAFKIAAIFACSAALLQPLSGDISARDVAKRQPAKLARWKRILKQVECTTDYRRVTDEKNKKVNYAIKLPGF